MANTVLSSLTAISSPATNDYLYILDTSDTTDSASGSSRKISRADFLGGTNVSQVVGTTETQTLTNKTLITPIISTISNTGSLTLPTSTDTLVGRATTDTLTNKTLTSPKVVAYDGIYVGSSKVVELGSWGTPANYILIETSETGSGAVVASAGSDTNVDLALTAKGTGVVKADGVEVVTLTGTQTLTNKSISGLTNPITHVPAFMFQQGLINGGFDVWQRATTFTTPNDDTYGPDRWNFIMDGNGSWTFARDTDVPTGNFKYSLKATNVTLNKQCGIVQILENINSVKYQGKSASLSFYAKTSGTEIGNLRATILSWTSTADAVTSDVVGTWAGNGTDPTWATNWTAEVSGSNKALISSWQRFTIENISIDTSSITNIAVVIWVDDTTIAANDDFWLTGIQMNVGTYASTYMPKDMGDELRDCQRYCYVPEASDVTTPFGFGTATSTTNAFINIQFPVVMRDQATLTATATDYQLYDGVTTTDMTSIALTGNQGSTERHTLSCGVGAGLTQYRPYFLISDGNANRVMIFNAEL